jgi:hypothetical protein
MVPRERDLLEIRRADVMRQLIQEVLRGRRVDPPETYPMSSLQDLCLAELLAPFGLAGDIGSVIDGDHD